MSVSRRKVIAAGAVCAVLFALLDTLTGSVTSEVKMIFLQTPTEMPTDKIVKSQTYWDRLEKAMVGFVVGVVVFIGSFFFAFAIEKLAVIHWLVSGRAKRSCVENVSSASVNKNLHCRMIHTTGTMRAQRPVCDPDVMYAPTSDEAVVALKRTVEVLQWHEHSHTDSESSSYTYKMEWTERDVDSSQFKETAGHYNPPRAIPTLETKTFYADVLVGAYKMSTEQLEKLKRWHASDLTAEDTLKVSPIIINPLEGFRFVGLRCGQRLTRVEGQVESRGQEYWSSIFDTRKMLPRSFLYVENSNAATSASQAAHGSTEQQGSVGDLRVSYDVVYEGPVSLVGVLQEDSFRAFNERDAHTMSGKLTEQPAELPASARDWREHGLFDRLFVRVMESRVPTSVLLVEERTASMAQLFAHDDTKFRMRILVLRIVCCATFSLGIYLIFSPITEILSFLPFIDSFLSSLFFIAAVLIGTVAWGLVAATLWCIYIPKIMTFLLIAVATCFHVSGAWIDHVSIGTLVPIASQPGGNPDSGITIGGAYVSDMALAEVIYLVALGPLGLVVYHRVQEWRFCQNVAQLNTNAGV